MISSDKGQIETLSPTKQGTKANNFRRRNNQSPESIESDHNDNIISMPQLTTSPASPSALAPVSSAGSKTTQNGDIVARNAAQPLGKSRIKNSVIADPNRLERTNLTSKRHVTSMQDQQPADLKVPSSIASSNRKLTTNSSDFGSARPRSQAAGVYQRSRAKANHRTHRGESGVANSIVEFGGALKAASPRATAYGSHLGFQSPHANSPAHDAGYSTNYHVWGQPRRGGSNLGRMSFS